MISLSVPNGPRPLRVEVHPFRILSAEPLAFATGVRARVFVDLPPGALEGFVTAEGYVDVFETPDAIGAAARQWLALATDGSDNG